MIQYPEIIQKLTERQKLALVCDGAMLSDIKINALGVPKVVFRRVEDKTIGAYAVGWNKQLFVKLLRKLYCDNGNDCVTVLMLPRLVPVPYPTNDNAVTSEDPYFLYNMYSDIGSDVVCCPCAKTTSSDYFADGKTNARARNEYYAFVPHMYNSVCVSVAATQPEQPQRKYVFAENTPSALLVKQLAEGKLLLTNGGAGSLRDALAAYRTMKEGINSGEYSLAEFTEACETYDVLTPELLDEAVDNVLSFAFDVAARKNSTTEETSESKSELLLQAAKEAIVLLKNDNVLPFSSNLPALHVVCNGEEAKVFGGSSLNGAVTVGLTEESARDDAWTEECLRRSGTAKYTLVLSASHDKLFGWEAALLHKLQENKVPTIVVTSSAVCCGQLSGLCSALLYAPEMMSRTEALIALLQGESPSGKLPFSCYNDVGAVRREIAEYLSVDKRHRAGMFVGYRRYLTGGTAPVYPFGYGLTYSKFAVSSVKCEATSVSATVQNNGKVAASEVVQVYVGKKDSVMYSPKYQLKGFTKVSLRPGESKGITIRLDPDLLGVFDAKTNTFKREDGTYEVYVATSCQTIAATTSTKIVGDKLETDGVSSEAYFPKGSNIVKQNYTVKPVKKQKAKKPHLHGIISLVVAAVIFAASFFLGTIAEIFTVIARFVALGVGGIGVILLVISIIRRAVYRAKQRKLAGIKQDTTPVTEDIATPDSINALFEKEFADEEPQQTDDDVFSDETYDADDEQPLDGQLFVKSILDNAAARGLAVSPDDVKVFASALSAYRLVAVDDSDYVKQFVRSVCEGMGGDFAEEDVTALDKKRYYLNSDGTDGKVLAALRTASANKVQFVYLKVNADCTDFITPFIRYFVRPDYTFETVVEDKQLTMSPNVWFVLASDSEKGGLPSDTLAQAVTSYISVAAGERKGEFVVNPVTPSQLSTFGKDARIHNSLTEKLWKKVDDLENMTSAFTPYHLGNRDCIVLERYIGALITYGFEQNAVLDIVAGTKLLPQVLALVDGKAEDPTEITQKIDFIFGEEDNYCKKAVAHSAFAAHNE